ncbi:MAG: sterol desaturase family protein [Gemmatimonadales bacterium]
MAAELTQNGIRLGLFLAGLFTLLSWELTSPHHAPTAPRFRRWTVNLSFAALNGVVVAALCAVCYELAAAGAAPWGYGPLEQLGLPVLIRLPVEVVMLDLVVYALHRGYHAIPALWRFHQVHHSDPDLDVTSASRFHLGEVLVSAVAKLALVLMLGISALGLVSFEILLLLAAQFQHANVVVRPGLERLLWWTFVPPAMHRIHHHPVQEEMDSNFGTLLTLWDRLFGTMRSDCTDEGRFGLPEGERGAASRLTSLLSMPFRQAPGRDRP